MNNRPPFGTQRKSSFLRKNSQQKNQNNPIQQAGFKSIFDSSPQKNFQNLQENQDNQNYNDESSGYGQVIRNNSAQKKQVQEKQYIQQQQTSQNFNRSRNNSSQKNLSRNSSRGSFQRQIQQNQGQKISTINNKSKNNNINNGNQIEQKQMQEQSNQSKKNEDILNNFLQNKPLNKQQLPKKPTIPRAPKLQTQESKLWEVAIKGVQKSLLDQFYKKNPNFDSENEEVKIKLLKQLVQEQEKTKTIQSYEKFFIDFRKLFNYNSIKENLPNKLIKRLALSLSVKINKQWYRDFKFVLQCENFASHIIAKITEQVQNLKFITTDKIEIEVLFYSKYLNTSVSVKKVYLTKEIQKNCVKQKVFNYFLDQHFILPFFNGDEQILYVLFEISAITLLRKFREELAQRMVMRDKNKVLQVKKQLKQKQKFFEREIIQVYENFQQYVNYQADFEVQFNVHNGMKKNLFTYVNTKFYPQNFDNQGAHFLIKSDEEFLVKNEFFLDNKIGIKEKVENLTLVDFVVKDRDNLLVTFSGFLQMRVLENSEKIKLDQAMQFFQEEFVAKVLEYEEKGLYKFRILVIQEGMKRARLKEIEFQIYPQIIQQYLM
ncbi:hypothetical protein PPERSA_06071 [Pseudocohnilembus persalinus]|uniref:Uncharacterized protein n=1 Tax=Pseudocohnilembus persalinus TaxID=266149 RepID=A0A0V0QVS0_PSEPJ|nr:hypothetical protein PPERSA_06071 [Pseudocohnilembus persalinus]|eukprot:KRX06189.1 hypothetical protein PPERSA_06071 [Pseudocohnilembus persalinus]